MIDDPALEEWAKGYVLRIQAEGREKFPNDGHAQIQHALRSSGTSAVRACRAETGKEPPEEEVWKLVDRWHILLSDPALHREMSPKDSKP